jgi:OmpA family
VVGPGRYLVFFAWDQATLTEADRQTISQAVEEYRRTGALQITATGHTDTSGSAAYNLELSVRRAEAVANELIRQGVPPAEITTVGQGEEDLLVPTEDGVREPRNRRVEIVVPQPPSPAPEAEAAPPLETEPAAPAEEEPGPFAFTIGPMYVRMPMKRVAESAEAGRLIRSKAATDSGEAGRHGGPTAAVARVAGLGGLVKRVAARPRSAQRGPARAGACPSPWLTWRRARGVAVDPRGRAS